MRTRTQEEGGPYQVWTCTCGVECGVLRDGYSNWLLYPLEGFDDPGLLDRLAPRQSREAQDVAVRWWQRNRARVERFRQSIAGSRPTTPPPPSAQSPPRESTSSRRRARPPPQPPPRRSAPRDPEPARAAIEQRSSYELLGVEPGASQDHIRKAYRKALKLCHPDRVANLDPEIQEVAHRKAKALRRAYEDLLSDQS